MGVPPLAVPSIHSTAWRPSLAHLKETSLIPHPPLPLLFYRGRNRVTLFPPVVWLARMDTQKEGPTNVFTRTFPTFYPHSH